MALIIKAQMPKGCGWDCHYVAVNKYYDERDDKIHKCVFCALNHSIRYKDSGIPEEYEHTRHPNCPIIGEIPDKHGDLIDRNELPIIGITDYKLEGHTVVEFEDVLNAPVIVEASNG